MRFCEDYFWVDNWMKFSSSLFGFVSRCVKVSRRAGSRVYAFA